MTLYENLNWALVVPLANEETSFQTFIQVLTVALNELKSGKVYLITDNASQDRTTELCQDLSVRDSRFESVYDASVKNVASAYKRGYVEAVKNKHDFILEMDAGLSHDPGGIKFFLDEFIRGKECVWGSRFIKGGSMKDAPSSRRFFSKTGTALSNFLLGTKLHDMTSGYQGFNYILAKKISEFPLKSTAHFYQTEVRYLLRKYSYKEIPIQYQCPSKSVNQNSLSNSLSVLGYYFWRRVTLQAISL